MDEGFITNLLAGINTIGTYMPKELKMTVKFDGDNGVSYLGITEITPEFLKDFRQLCLKHYEKTL